MPETAQHLLGQLADGRFPLRKLLGVSPNSAVFLTSLAPERPGDPSPDAAIKLIPEDAANSDSQLAHWRAAAALAHPGLLRILHCGRCNIDGSSCLYIVTELADEDLGQLLPTRALTPDETRGTLAPVLSALDFLHENALVHAGLKPSNIHAIGDNVKLSADRILPSGESLSSWPLAAPYAAPESILFPASDLWSLGMSLCETLTKSLPVREPSGQFTLPDLPAPFSEIVRAALVEDATLRITLDQARSLLDPSFVPKRRAAATTPVAAPVAAPSPVGVVAVVPESPESLIDALQPAAHAAAVSVPSSSRNTSRQPLPQIDPLAVPLSPVSPPSRSYTSTQPTRASIPVSSLPHVNATIGGPRRVVAAPVSQRSNKLILVSAIAALLLAVLFIPRFFLRSSNSSAPNSSISSAASASPENSTGKKTSPSSSKSSSGTPTSGLAASHPVTAPAKNSDAANSAAASRIATSRVDLSNSSSASDSPNASHPTSAGSSSAAFSATSSGTPAATSAARPSVPALNPLAPAVLRKVLPVVSEKARGTINGTVRINVRVQLNPDGTVSSAELANPAGSQFFADLALKAAQQWRFGPPSSDNSPSIPSSAVIRFDFTQTATSAYLP